MRLEQFKDGHSLSEQNLVGKLIEELRELNRIVGKSIINILKKEKEMQNCVSLLKMKKNIILQGAPGTGKTWNTAEIAVRLIDGENANLSNHKDVMKRYEELQKEDQIAFCTLHQSMDYEDFVEGLKPEVVEGRVNYKVEDGIFKQICEKSKENTEKKNYILY